LGDLSGLMVTSEDGESILIAHLQGDKQGHGLHGVVSAINIISHEEVVGVRGLSANLEEFSQVVELSVDVTTDGHGGAHLLHVGLVDQDFFCL